MKGLKGLRIPSYLWDGLGPVERARQALRGGVEEGWLWPEGWERSLGLERFLARGRGLVKACRRDPRFPWMGFWGRLKWSIIEEVDDARHEVEKRLKRSLSELRRMSD